MRRLQLPRCSFREDADPADMAGAIFMSNSETREHCFGAGVFGLPPEYERFVVRVRQGMPLFLFDYTERKLYGVFEATSDGGMDIHRGAFRFTGRTYPAQVCFSIVWKCRPLTEDEFFPAIEDNYYISKKFYFDLSCQQVVNLYGLFDKKRVPAGDDRSYLTPYVPSYPHLSQHNANLGDDYENCEQCKAIYASEHQHLNRAKSRTPELTQQGIPAYPEALEVSAISEQKECFAGYIPIPDCTEDFERDQPRRDFNRDVSGSSGSGHDTNHDVGAESNITVPSQRQQKTVFSRLSVKPQPPPQEIPGPSLNQLLYSLSKRTEQWSSKTRSPTEDVCKQLVSAQDIDRPYAPSELNLPTELEEESVDPPFLNFKRRSKAASLDTNGGNEGSGKPKRRKLVRPSFGQSNNTQEKKACSGKELQENAVVEMNHSPAKTVGKELQENVIMEMTHTSDETVGNKLQENVTMERNHSPVETGGNDLQENVIMEMTHTHVETVENKLQDMMERNHSPVETGGNKFYIDLNEPASVDSDLVEDASIVTPPPVAVKTQIEKPSEVDINQLSCSNSKEVNSKQDQSSGSDAPPEKAPTEKITLDLNITDLNTMDEAKLQAILGSSLLQALDKLRNGKSNDSEKANKSSLW
ncbi:hypothetical protein ACQ4PT_021268 [Festuca glaucescens]